MTKPAIVAELLSSAHVAELVDAHGSGPCAARCGGSSPSVGTKCSMQQQGWRVPRRRVTPAQCWQQSSTENAHVAELVDAHGSGPCAARCGGSSPSVGTNVFWQYGCLNAHVAELVDAHGSGPCAARCGGSSPSVGTKSYPLISSACSIVGLAGSPPTRK